MGPQLVRDDELEPEWRAVAVAGGTGALGRALVTELLDRTWRVHVPWHDESEVVPLLEHLREHAEHFEETSHRRLHLSRVDMTDAEAVEDFFEVAAEQGALRAAVNLVGGFAPGGIDETDADTWERMFRVNATTAFLCARAAVPHIRTSLRGEMELLRERGGSNVEVAVEQAGRRGRIINVAAVPAVRGGAGMSAYAASKAAVASLTRSLAEELRDDGISVNAVAPEIMDTPANRAAMPEADTSRWLDPAEVARVIRFLLDEDGAAMSGNVIVLSKCGVRE